MSAGYQWACQVKHFDGRWVVVGAGPFDERWRAEDDVAAWLRDLSPERVRLARRSVSLWTPATDSHASVSPEQTPSPAADSAHRGDQCTVGETP